jgi:quercetin dioxygenase-like cupin family protein
MDLLLHEGLDSPATTDRTGSTDGTLRTVAVTSVTFTPGSRTHWHRHSAGQLLVVVSGEGWVGDRVHGQQVVRVGDLVWTPPGEDHWHGATNDSLLTHVALTLGATHWYDEPVDVPGADG